ncbi:MAG: DUF2835 domain-containing protein [Candidatus Scalindua sp.]|nr:DUF2835 domain-containing protein [Candidatus Scalindua sp.]
MNDEHKRFQFSLHISPDDYAAYYKGLATSVFVETYCGRKVKFPASVLRQFVTRNGIHGMFEMVVDQNNKLMQISRISGNPA